MGVGSGGPDMARSAATRWGIAVALALVGLAALVPLAETKPQHDLPSAQFVYQNGALASGEGRLACAAHSFRLTGEQPNLVGWAHHGSLHVVQVWQNSTYLLPATGSPVKLHHEATRQKSSFALDPQDLRIYAAPTGRLVAFGLGAFRAPTLPFSLAATPPEVSVLAVGAQADSQDYWYPIGTDAAALGSEPVPTASSRLFETRGGPAEIAGAVTLYLEEAVVTAAGERFTLPEYRASEATTLPGLLVLKERFTFGWLDLADATLTSLGSEAVFSCTDAHFDLTGTFTAYNARGEVKLGDSHVTFDRQELVLQGQFVLDEHVAAWPHRGSNVEAEASGRFSVVGVDFELAAVPRPALPGEAVAIGLTALALLLLGWLLYSRFGAGDLLNQAERRRLYTAIVEEPGLDLADIVARIPMSESNARYHLRHLEQRRLIRSVRIRGRYRYLPGQHDPRRAQQDLLLAQDEKVRDLFERVPRNEAVDAGRLAQAARETWHLSRAGAWKVLGRALGCGLLVRDEKNPRLVRRAG
jgi:predicted transcriptional regulator